MIQLFKIFSLAAIILLFNWWFPIWWSILILPLVFSALFSRKLFIGFYTSFFAGLISWGTILTYQFLNGSQLIADRVSDAFELPGRGITILIGTILIGGLLAAIGGITGSSLLSVFVKKQVKNYY